MSEGKLDPILGHPKELPTLLLDVNVVTWLQRPLMGKSGNNLKSHNSTKANWITGWHNSPRWCLNRNRVTNTPTNWGEKDKWLNCQNVATETNQLTDRPTNQPTNQQTEKVSLILVHAWLVENHKIQESVYYMLRFSLLIKLYSHVIFIISTDCNLSYYSRHNWSFYDMI
jgi:hypothetical protein